MSNFPDARAKIERALKHIGDFQDLSDEYCSPASIDPIPTYGVEANEYKITLTIPPIPPQLSPILGDAIHCLRSSLDYAAQKLFSPHTSKQFIYFPFRERLSELETWISKCPEFLAAGADNIILDYILPYKIDDNSGSEGNKSLWMMNKLDNIVKHRNILLIKNNSKVIVSSASLRMVGSSGYISKDGNVISSAQRLVASCETNANVSLKFAEDYFKGEDVLPVLYDLLSLVSSAIDAREPLA